MCRGRWFEFVKFEIGGKIGPMRMSCVDQVMIGND
jgi:hypothetical protein